MISFIRKMRIASHTLVSAIRILLILGACTFPAATALGQTPADAPETTFRHSLDFSPLSPLFNIYAIHYCYKITPSSELIAGPLYMNIPYKDIGHTNAPGFILGYRRYIWKSLHIDYQLMPGWDRFYEENERKTYRGFDLWNEFRLGYSWDFTVGSLPLFVNVQWPFGFALYSDPDGKPESFKKHAKEEPFFYYPAMVFVGIRF
jgi:hypothetical protein